MRSVLFIYVDSYALAARALVRNVEIFLMDYSEERIIWFG